MKAFVTDPGTSGNVVLQDVQDPSPAPNETLVRVSAFSLNRGEVKFAAGRDKGSRIGWDVAGIVEKAAADGSGPKEGERVVAFSARSEGWAELVAVPTHELATVPEGVSDEAASTLPVAGLTALYTLERGSDLFGTRVLITGATGGVGHFALQIARLMGAEPVAQVRHERQEHTVREEGAAEVIVTEDGSGLEGTGPYRHAVDAVGGEMLGHILHELEDGGSVISYGLAAGTEATIQIIPDLFGMNGQRRVEGFTLYIEKQRKPAADGLRRLLAHADEGGVTPLISRVENWEKTPELCEALMNREFEGKAVLTID